MAGNDGTLNQRETGVGIFDELTFQNDAPAGFAGRNLEKSEAEEEYDNWHGHQIAYNHDEVEPAPWEQGDASATDPQEEKNEQSEYSAMFSDEELEVEGVQTELETDYDFLTDEETEAQFAEQELEEAAMSEAELEEAEREAAAEDDLGLF